MLAQLLLACLLAACGTRDVADLRLDGLGRPRIVNFQPDVVPPYPDFVQPAIVAELSTGSNLRGLTSGADDGVAVRLVTCGGRSRIASRETRFNAILVGGLSDELAFVNHRRPRSQWPPPVDGRHRYSVAIVLRQEGWQQDFEGVLWRSLAELDLMRDPVDLCLFIENFDDRRRWRSNTVVIPAAVIRAAIDGAQSSR